MQVIWVEWRQQEGTDKKGCGRQGQREKHSEAQAVYISKETGRLAERELPKKKKKRGLSCERKKKTIFPLTVLQIP